MENKNDPFISNSSNVGWEDTKLKFTFNHFYVYIYSCNKHLLSDYHVHKQVNKQNVF